MAWPAWLVQRREASFALPPLPPRFGSWPIKSFSGGYFLQNSMGRLDSVWEKQGVFKGTRTASLDSVMWNRDVDGHERRESAKGSGELDLEAPIIIH